MILTAERKYTYGLTDLINQFCSPKQTTVKLIHIKTEAEYNVLMRAFELKGFKPFEIGAGFQGERYIEYTDHYLAYRPNDWNVTNGLSEIIPFEDFINDHK